MKIIHLSQDQIAQVDDADFDWLIQWSWYAYRDGMSDTFYAGRNQRGSDGKMRRVQMHAQILGVSNSIGDHKDHNGLNNQRSNLRIATKSQNGANRRKKKNSASKYLGVFFRKDRRKWKAEIRKNGVLRCVGLFSRETDAARAYNEAASKLHGEFANLNVIE